MGAVDITWFSLRAGPLAPQCHPVAKSFLEQVDVGYGHDAFDIGVFVTMLSCEGSALVKCLLKVAGTVHDDVPALSEQVAGKDPLKTVCKLGRSLERDTVVEEEGFDQVVVDDHGVD